MPRPPRRRRTNTSYRANKPTVKWNVGQGPSVRPVQSPPELVETPTRPGSEEALKAALVPGVLFTLKRPTAPEVLPAGYAPRTVPALFENFWGNPPGSFPEGQPAIYLGTERCMESRGKMELRVVRHTFLVGGCRYCLANLGLLQKDAP